MSSSFALKPPSFTSIPLWANVSGIPFDLYTQEGLGRVVDLLGAHVEVDDFTRRMVNINVAHLKIKVDCTKPLPTSAEIERENGEVVTITIDYPWILPICPCCKEMGHLEALCPNAKWSPKDNNEYVIVNPMDIPEVASAGLSTKEISTSTASLTSQSSPPDRGIVNVSLS